MLPTWTKVGKRQDITSNNSQINAYLSMRCEYVRNLWDRNRDSTHTWGRFCTRLALQSFFRVKHGMLSVIVRLIVASILHLKKSSSNTTFEAKSMQKSITNIQRNKKSLYHLRARIINIKEKEKKNENCYLLGIFRRTFDFRILNMIFSLYLCPCCYDLSWSFFGF